MATRKSTVETLLEQAAGAGHVTAKAMFGEYGLYCDDRLVGSICDDQLYLKPTAAGRALAGEGTAEASPYPGAKPCLLISGERWEDGAWLSRLVAATAAALAENAPRRRRKPRGT